MYIFYQDYVVVNCNGMYADPVGHERQMLLVWLEKIEMRPKENKTLPRDQTDYKETKVREEAKSRRCAKTEMRKHIVLVDNTDANKQN